MTGTQAIKEAIAQLRAAGVADPARDARRLFAHAANVAPDRVSLILGDPVENDFEVKFQSLIARRAAHEPVAHLTGLRAFYGRDFAVTAQVLDPRPETEILVMSALEMPFGTVLDLGTGSGCILISLLAERPAAIGTGTDLSPKALDIARSNADRHGLSDRAQFCTGDWMAGITDCYDLIVSNPPYIAAAEFDHLDPDVRLWEPRMALTDDGDGLAAYRAIIAQAPDRLTRHGWLMVEIGPSQGRAVSDLMRAAGFAQVTMRPDLDGRDRVVAGQIGDPAPPKPVK